jgi:hypothetical protein
MKINNKNLSEQCEQFSKKLFSPAFAVTEK